MANSKSNTNDKSEPKRKQSLGKGLDALFGQERDTEETGSGLLELRINDVEPDVNQPRKNFDMEKLQTLAESIKEQGLIQPILVRKGSGGAYLIVSGERRYKAAMLAGLVRAATRDQPTPG